MMRFEPGNLTEVQKFSILTMGGALSIFGCAKVHFAASVVLSPPTKPGWREGPAVSIAVEIA
jgi:hypothetical protein